MENYSEQKKKKGLIMHKAQNLAEYILQVGWKDTAFLNLEVRI